MQAPAEFRERLRELREQHAARDGGMRADEGGLDVLETAEDLFEDGTDAGKPE